MAFTLPMYHPPDFAQPPLKDAPLAHFAPVVQPGVAPEHYHATSIFPEYYQLAQSRWVLLAYSRMDCVVVKTPEESLLVKEFHHLEVGEQVAVGWGKAPRRAFSCTPGLLLPGPCRQRKSSSHPALPGDLLLYRLR